MSLLADLLNSKAEELNYSIYLNISESIGQGSVNPVAAIDASFQARLDYGVSEYATLGSNLSVAGLAQLGTIGATAAGSLTSGNILYLMNSLDPSEITQVERLGAFRSVQIAETGYGQSIHASNDLLPLMANSVVGNISFNSSGITSEIDIIANGISTNLAAANSSALGSAASGRVQSVVQTAVWSLMPQD